MTIKFEDICYVGFSNFKKEVTNLFDKLALDNPEFIETKRRYSSDEDFTFKTVLDKWIERQVSYNVSTQSIELANDEQNIADLRLHSVRRKGEVTHQAVELGIKVQSSPVTGYAPNKEILDSIVKYLEAVIKKLAENFEIKSEVFTDLKPAGNLEVSVKMYAISKGD